MEYYEQTQPFPGYAPIIPGRSPGYYPIQSFGRPDQSDPFATYALPISRPPVVVPHTRHHRHHGSYGEVASHTRHHRHHESYGERLHRGGGRSRGQDHRQHVHSYERKRALAEYPDHTPSSDEDFTDASLESDVSEALSANTFIFDGSIPGIGNKQRDDEEEGEVCEVGVVKDGGKGGWRSGRLPMLAEGGDRENGGHGGGWDPNTTTYEYARVEVVKNRGRKARTPSPYLSSGSTVLYSRFVGDAVPQWDYCTADLSVVASDDLVRLKKEPLFRWVYVLLLLRSSNANAFRHLQGRHPNFSSLIVGPLPSLTVRCDKFSICFCLCICMLCDCRSADNGPDTFLPPCLCCFDRSPVANEF